jgi:NTE family protein
MKRFYILVLLIFILQQGYSQKVGLVLSGGGARGLAHIAVIRVLEENHIPIDYITGTSMGAIIGGLYAAGYNCDEMEKLFRSDEFYFWSTGKIQEEYRYYFKQSEENPGWIELRMEKKDDKLRILPPTNVIPQWQMDFAFMQMMASTDAISRNNFDSLFVPFRCVATEVDHNRQVILSKGDMGEAIRASMTVPLYFKPIEIDGQLMFDGGIVNNFPHDVMKATFKPDIMIGHKVVNYPRPAEADDIIRQITNMVQRPTDYDIDPKDGILLQTDVSQVGILDFERLDFVLEEGRKTAEKMIDSIKSRIPRRVDPEVLARRREAFQSRKPALLFQNIQVEGVEDPLQQKYIINSIKHNKNVFTIEMFKKEYFKLLTNEQIKSIRPLAIFNEKTGYFDVLLKVEAEKKGEITVGGNISTKPINQGFVNFQYRLFKERSYTLNSNLYFGRFYSSFKMGGRIDFPTVRPIYFASYLTYNRWDYFSTSNELFFEDVRPPFIKQNETNFRNEVGLPIGLQDKISIGAAWSGSWDSYYQIEKYNKNDNPDETDFNAFNTHIEYEKNTLNQKQYASNGIYTSLSFGYIAGREKYIPGNTTGNVLTTRQNHNYLLVKGMTEKYFNLNKRFVLGGRFDGVLSNKKNFANYTSTLLAAPSFHPTPHSSAIYINNFHANNFIAGGIKGIYRIKPNLQFRLEGYAFLPFHQIEKGKNLEAIRSDRFITRAYYQGLSALVLDTGIGPASIAVNYYDKDNAKWFFTLNFGYILFNKRGF